MKLKWDDISGAALGVGRAGLKHSGGDDLVVIHAPGVAAALTTESSAAAAPCRWTRERVPGPISAVVINAGNANAATGPKGEVHTAIMAKKVAQHLECEPDEVLVCSTGVIGVPLPIEAVEKAIEEACSDLNAPVEKAAKAILTTDTCTKESAFDIRGVQVAGFAKGSGMIHPNMATMLAFLLTNVDINSDLLQALLARCVTKTFNAITVDGDTSTNDTVIIQATGKGPRVLAQSPEHEAFEEALLATCMQLAKAIARDGEGANQLLEVHLKGLDSDQDAFRASKAVARSPLVKSAIHGHDPNWGRIVGALGAAGVPNLDRVSVQVCGHCVLHEGQPLTFDEREVSEAMTADPVRIDIELPGDGHGWAFGCDLSAEYVSINSDYRT